MGRDTRPSGLAVLLAAVPWVFSAVVLLGSLLFGFGLKCDESCYGGGWRHEASAWQWNLIPLAGVIAFASTTAFVVYVWRRRPWTALAALVIGTGSALASVSIFAPISRDDLERHPLVAGACAVIILVGLFSVLLSTPTERDPGPG